MKSVGAAGRIVAVALAVGCLGCGERPQATATNQADTDATSRKLAGLKHFWGLFQRATEARVGGEIDHAVALYKEALTIDPNHEDSLFYLGQCYKARGEYQQALESWQRLVTLQPQAHRGFSQIGILLSSARVGAPYDLDRARAAFAAAFAMNPEESGSMLHLGELAVAVDDAAAATRWLEGVQRINPRAVGAPFLLGYVAWVSGDHAKASAGLSEAARRLLLEKPKGASFEGQTTKGAEAMVEASRVGHSLLGPFWEAWARERVPGSAVEAAEVETVYRAIDRFLGKLRAEGPDAARPLRPEV